MITAFPTHGFARPPYTARLYSKDSGWSGVENCDGFNALSFPEKPGAKFTSLEEAMEIADDWNRKAAP